MKKILIGAGIIVLLGLGVWYWSMSDATKVSNEQSLIAQSSGEQRMTGVIQTVVNEQPFDGNLKIIVNNQWVIIGGGMLPHPDAGALIGFDPNVSMETYAGKTVEVYAKDAGDGTLSILDDRKYYVKLIE